MAHQMVAPEVRTAWASALAEALALIESHPVQSGLLSRNLTAMGGIARLRLHGDCHPCNILWKPRELALTEPLRTLRLIHHSTWLARRWGEPAFPMNFPWFGSCDCWQ
jgi:Ser/Thr protein kinase RdoA (MazF antagonist)